MTATYLVYYYTKDGNSQTDYISADTAQQAADYVRSADDVSEVVEVAKVVKNWR